MFIGLDNLLEKIAHEERYYVTFPPPKEVHYLWGQMEMSNKGIERTTIFQ